MIITRNFDSVQSIRKALLSIEEELNSRNLFPAGAPKLLIEAEHRVLYDDSGSEMFLCCGVISQKVTTSHLAREIHYAIHEFGMGYRSISEALEKIDAEIEQQKGNAIDDIQILKVDSCRIDNWIRYSGVVTQAYSVNTLQSAFK